MCVIMYGFYRSFQVCHVSDQVVQQYPFAQHPDGWRRNGSCSMPAARRKYRSATTRCTSRVLRCKCVSRSNAAAQLVSRHVVLSSAEGTPIYVLGVDHLSRQYDLGMCHHAAAVLKLDNGHLQLNSWTSHSNAEAHDMCRRVHLGGKAQLPCS